MKLSSQKDLLLIIILSGAVLIMGWLKLIKGYPLSLLPTILVLFLPGYALLTAIWPNDERMGWTLRGGLGFAIGLFFILFLPIILTSLKWESITSNLNQILLILAIVFSLVAMARRKEPTAEKESARKDAQLTLEESIERAALMRQNAEAEPNEYGDYDDEDYYAEGDPEDDLGDEKREEEEEPQIYQDLKEEKPLQYERLKDRYSSDEKQLAEEYPLKDHEHEEEPLHKGVPLRVEEPVKTSPADYESEMDKPVWIDEPEEKKSGFRNWDLVMILFLSGVSLLFLYFNPLKTTTTSIIFFILLLFILGYAGLTIIYPDKSRVSTRNLTITTGVIAIILFMISFLAWWTHLLPEIPKYLVQIMFVASIIMSAGAFIRKWRATHDVTPTGEVAEEEIHEEVTGEDISKQEVLTEEVPATEEPLVTEEKKPLEQSSEEPSQDKKDTLDILKNLGKQVIVDKEVSEEPEPKPSEEDESGKPFLGGSKWEKALSIILIISLILAISATIYIIVTPKQGEKFTEFYILGQDGKASNYPTNLTTGQNGSVIIGVVNHEYTTTDYLLLVKVNNSTLQNQTLTLTSGQKMEIPFNFTAGTSGEKKMEFLLYKLPNNDTAYRSLHLWLNVR